MNPASAQVNRTHDEDRAAERHIASPGWEKKGRWTEEGTGCFDDPGTPHRLDDIYKGPRRMEGIMD